MDKKYLIGAGADILVIGLVIALYATYPEVKTYIQDSDYGEEFRYKVEGKDMNPPKGY